MKEAFVTAIIRPCFSPSSSLNCKQRMELNNAQWCDVAIHIQSRHTWPKSFTYLVQIFGRASPFMLLQYILFFAPLKPKTQIHSRGFEKALEDISSWNPPEPYSSLQRPKHFSAAEANWNKIIDFFFFRFPRTFIVLLHRHFPLLLLLAPQDPELCGMILPSGGITCIPPQFQLCRRIRCHLVRERTKEGR